MNNEDEIILCRKVTKDVGKNKWIASLSNGETIFEDKIKSLPPTWERLGFYVKKHGLAITNLRLQIGELQVELPANQPGYIQKKRVESTGSWSKFSLCIGYAQGGKAMIHQVDSNRGSHTVYCDDPGEPFTIYRHDTGD